MQPTTEQIQRLRAFGSATIYEAQGQTGALDSAIKPIDPGFRVAGPALTVDSRPADNLVLHFALLKATAGAVIIVDAKGFTEAGPWGDVMTTAAQAAGLAGLVIDGSVRDATTIVEMNFPVFSRGVCIKSTGKGQSGAVNGPIVCGGVPVRSGDIVVGDRDGVVIVAADKVEWVIARCEEREAKEAQQRGALREGATTVDLLGFSNLADKIRFH